ncbi:MAG: extracellular solute-binding protein [Treponema sp.]|jgi:putative aldouronate transport system substrate-binding protein|nr:extracellular solute-binding protein [Treponema sp.]
MKKVFLVLSLAVFFVVTVNAGGTPQGGSAAAGQKPVLKGFAYVNNRLTTAVSNFNEVWAFKEAERATGIHVDWIHPPVGQETEQCNLMIASGDLPDFIYINYNNIGGLSKLLADKTIIKLNEYLDAGKLPGYKSWVEKYPEIRKQLLMDDGTLAGFFMLRIREYQGQLGWFSNGGIIMRKDWLDKLNLKVPTTIREYEEALRAFKTRDPNGNGKADELPLVTGSKDFSSYAQQFGLADDFYDLNGTAKYGPLEPKYRDYIGTLARWYKEGLIDPDYTTVDAKMYQARYIENRAGSSSDNAGSTATLYEIMKDTIPDVNFVGISNLKNDDGKVYSTLGDLRQSFVNEASMITSGCKNIDAALKYLDYAYTAPGYLAFNWGEPNVSYTVRDGKNYFTDEIIHNPKGYPLDRALTQYAMSMCQWSIPKDPEYWVQVTLRYDFQKEAIDNWGKVDYAIAMPPISRTPEETRRFAQIMNDVNTLKNETVTKIILGTEPLSALDTMAGRMKSLGIDEALKIQQDALDRYNARK